MKALSIGNSFSQAAQRYLHGIAGADNRDTTCVKLFIGVVAWRAMRKISPKIT